MYSFILGTYMVEIGIDRSYSFYKANKHRNETLNKPFLMPLWYPFDKNKYYSWAFCYEVAMVFVTALYTSSVYAFINSIIIFARAQVKILQHSFSNFDNYAVKIKRENSDDIILVTLKAFVMKHHKLINWLDELDNSLNVLLLLEYSITSVTLAAITIQIYAGRDSLYQGLYLTLIFLQLLILAWNADEIKEQSSNLADALYSSNWYEQTQKVKVFIHIMMVRCQKPLTLSIGPFGAMTANAALSRAKLAYSYVSLMSGNNKP
ncbi:odorant receptor Or2-like [Cylas formicarius]|uniref:odorant receptor Or2-like n=1 Tax=Cylas formicarius TaxID=197179 RepID=UPI0029586ED9|nr:odorant receptor Or2-like [Cylas formicarius]